MGPSPDPAHLRYEAQQDNTSRELVITETPHLENENTNALVAKLATTRGISCDQNDYKAFRAINKNQNAKVNREQPPKIIVQINNQSVKEALTRAKDVLDHPPQGTEDNAICVNENLTPTTRKLYYQARKFKQREQYRFVWVRDGEVYLRKTETSGKRHIRNDHDLEKLGREDKNPQQQQQQQQQHSLSPPPAAADSQEPSQQDRIQQLRAQGGGHMN